jgi:hypothetical protein
MGVVGPIGPARTLAQMKDDRTSGLMVGTNDSGGVGVARLIDGDVEWREDWDADEAIAIGRELIRLGNRQKKR